MKNTILCLTAAALCASAPMAAAKHHAQKQESANAPNMALEKILRSETRKDDKPRDKYRNPLATLQFMGITPDMTVAEYAPGGGWYSRILAPYLHTSGKFIGIQFTPDLLPFPDERKERIRTFNDKFPKNVAKWTGLEAGNFSGYTMDTIPNELNGTVDFIFVPRMLHNLLRWNMADSEIKAMRALLKDDGYLGIVQHRAKADAPYSYSDGNKGYLREADVINFMNLHGFDLAKKSEINANAKDTANYDAGVWTLLPRLRTPKDDPETKAKYRAIGESDRMTLLFRKRP